MRYYSLIISLLLPLCSSYGSPPVSTPARFGGLDTLTKAARLDSRRAENERLKPSKFGGNMTQGTLIEDPRVIFSTYCGGNGYDCGNSLAVDSHGDVYIVGYTGSSNFPVSDDAWQKEKKGGHDMFLGKFKASGERVWLTYFGGSNTDVAVECVADKDDNLIVVGKTDSPDFPTTEGVEQDSAQGGIDVVIVKFSPDGKLLWSRYYGGTDGDVGEGIALCSNGTDFVITGSTLSRDWDWHRGIPITKGTYQDTLGLWTYDTNYWMSDAFLAKLSGEGKLIWGTYLGGDTQDAAHAVAVDKDGNIAVVGETEIIGAFKDPVFPTTTDAFHSNPCAKKDIFYSKFSPLGKLLYSTLYCGNTASSLDETNDPNDYATDVKFDDEGAAVFCGYTGSKLFPTTADAYKPKYDSYDAVLVKFSKENQRVWSTYFGGASGAEIAYSLAIDSNDNLWIGGTSNSSDFYISPDTLIGKNPGGIAYNIITKFNNMGYPIWSSVYFVSFCYKVIVKKNNDFYFTGETGGYKFPITNNAFQTNVDPENYSYTNYLVHIDLDRKTDVIDMTTSCNISVFPNPANDMISINLSVYDSLNIIIYNIIGTKVLERNLQNSVNEIDLSVLPVGTYFIAISSNFYQCTIPFIKN